MELGLRETLEQISYSPYLEWIAIWEDHPIETRMIIPTRRFSHNSSFLIRFKIRIIWINYKIIDKWLIQIMGWPIAAVPISKKIRQDKMDNWLMHRIIKGSQIVRQTTRICTPDKLQESQTESWRASILKEIKIPIRHWTKKTWMTYFRIILHRTMTHLQIQIPIMNMSQQTIIG